MLARRSPTTLDSVAYAPLLIKEPGQNEGATDDTNVMAIDLVPTIAELLGLEPTWALDGAVIGSAAITARGSTKVWYDIRDPFSPRLEGVVEFDDAATFPRAADRSIGPLGRPERSAWPRSTSCSTPAA